MERWQEQATPRFLPGFRLLPRPVSADAGLLAAGHRQLDEPAQTGLGSGHDKHDARSHAGYRFAPTVTSHAVRLYFRFPLSLRMVEEMLADRGIAVSHETVRQWGLKFGQTFANGVRRRLPRSGDKRHVDGVVPTIAGRRTATGRPGDGTGP